MSRYPSVEFSNHVIKVSDIIEDDKWRVNRAGQKRQDSFNVSMSMLQYCIDMSDCEHERIYNTDARNLIDFILGLVGEIWRLQAELIKSEG